MSFERVTIGPHTLYRGDALEVLPHLDGIDAVITDPPWGIDADTDYTRFVGGLSDDRNSGNGIWGDGRPFDPMPWLGFRHVALWGGNCFANRLPLGRWLVWLKKRDNQIGTFLSDAELCWVKWRRTPKRAPGVYVKQHIWHGFDRETERGKVLHPMQKPATLMAWTLKMAGVPDGASVIDPYMGCCPTGVACARTGRRFVGVELCAEYFDIACQRLQAALDETPLFADTP